MLVARVEQETRAGLDRDGETESAQPIADDRELAHRIGIVRVESVMVEGEGDAAIAQLSEDGQGVVEMVVRETIGIVAETHPRPRRFISTDTTAA